MTWNTSVREIILNRIAEGESLKSICRDDDMPSFVSVFSWLKTDKEFLNQYEKAKELQAECFFDELVEIADNATDDIELIVDSQGNSKEQIKRSAIQRARLQVDTRKWAISKMLPKKYGDKSYVENRAVDENGKDIAPVAPLTPESIAAAVLAIRNEYK